jgi:hypothetical protein
LQRIRGLNEFLEDVFARTRKKTPAYVIIDLGPTNDACHGHQQLSFWHGYPDLRAPHQLEASEGWAVTSPRWRIVFVCDTLSRTSPSERNSG